MSSKPIKSRESVTENFANGAGGNFNIHCSDVLKKPSRVVHKSNTCSDLFSFTKIQGYTHTKYKYELWACQAARSLVLAQIIRLLSLRFSSLFQTDVTLRMADYYSD